MSENNMSILYVLLALAVFCAGAGAIWFGVKTHTVTRTHTVKVEKSWGKPDAVVDGTSLSPRLAGLTCRGYNAKRTVVCS